MKRIYSKIYPDKLLHFVVRADFKEGRQDLISSENFLQCSTLKLNAGTTFKPHRHKWRERSWDVIAQESWHVIKGRVKCFFYDLNNELIAQEILNTGDTSFTLEGGHNYLILEDGTEVLEYKTGKYEGQDIDKQFI